MPIQIPFPIPSHGVALNSKMRINLEFLVGQFNEFNSGTATWDTVAIGTPNNLTGTLTFWNASNVNYFTIQAGATFANTTLTLPANAIPNPTSNFLSFDSSGIGTWISGSAAFAPTNATYVTMSLSSDLSNERVLTAGGGIGISDGGANSTVTISNNGVTSITGTANQVIAGSATGGVTLSLPQSIATSSDVQFGTVRTTATGNGTNPSVAIYDSNTGFYRTGNDLYLILSGSIVAQTFFADLSTRFPKVATASLVLRDTGGSNPTVTINPPSGFTSYTLTMPVDDGTSNQVLTTNGSGVLSWTTPSSSGATTALDNLAAVAINTTLVSDTNNTDDLGTTSIGWRSLYIATSIKSGSTTLATTTELGYLTGVTSAIQTQLGTKASTALSNLASVAINTALVSDTNNTDDLGTAAISWKDLFITGTINNGSTIAITPDSSGRVNQPNQPCFLVTAPSNTANVTGDSTDATCEYDTEIFDVGANFNSGTYTFTAPITGRYSFNAGLQWAGASVVTFGHLDIVTSNRTYRESIGTRSAVDGMSVAVVEADMDAGDTCSFVWNLGGGTKTAEMTNDATYNYCSGSLIN